MFHLPVWGQHLGLTATKPTVAVPNTEAWTRLARLSQYMEEGQRVMRAEWYWYLKSREPVANTEEPVVINTFELDFD